eukprot:gnl/TRDRNA2_/TRDRNA2_27931_c0_seq1.p2 gnl/TRDRNA2_/TRDRNA2_27931_c0~~gnl/TRDRNA2_/TRDRNA2_27931_c0_seq1.p2  ORF type:complete len:102 (+),score=0.37 gnl/TRDRNA2_/TRDRNA2_27931_c0_seq1:81-386(+)
MWGFRGTGVVKEDLQRPEPDLSAEYMQLAVICGPTSAFAVAFLLFESVYRRSPTGNPTFSTARRNRARSRSERRSCGSSCARQGHKPFERLDKAIQGPFEG